MRRSTPKPRPLKPARRRSRQCRPVAPKPPPRTTRARVTFDHDAPEVFVERAGEANYARTDPEHELSPQARQFAGMRMADLARETLHRRGFSTTGMSEDTLITRALHSTSDFPEILGNTVNRHLRRAYAASPDAAKKLARQTTARDFRDKKAIMMGAAPTLEKVLEGGEITYGTIAESAEAYKLETFAKLFGISRQALVNDDQGAFGRIAVNTGAGAKAFEASQIAAQIVANPNLSDGNPVFDATAHGNQSASAGSTVANLTTDLGIVRQAMRRQTGLAGEPIGLTPKYILVPPELETAMEQAVSTVQATKTSDTNPFSALTLIVDPRLTNTSQWYLIADPAQIDGLEYAYLEGAPGPQIETKAGFEVDGLLIKVRLDFGTGWIDYRGWYRVG